MKNLLMLEGTCNITETSEKLTIQELFFLITIHRFTCLCKIIIASHKFMED